MTEYSQGICQDGAAILRDGKMMTVEEILDGLRSGAKLAENFHGCCDVQLDKFRGDGIKEGLDHAISVLTPEKLRDFVFRNTWEKRNSMATETDYESVAEEISNLVRS